MQIGPHSISPTLVLAPMAGVTDRAFRTLCRKLGAGLAVSEMTISDARFWNTEKSRTRMDHHDEPGPISVQIAGNDPTLLAQAARHNVALGAQIIDINMGCPAKKVCKADAGSALMRDEALVERICRAVVAAVSVPVTLKIRTGWSRAERNALTIARIAEDAGIAALAVHGRARDDHFNGAAEYETIASIKRAVRIPVLANGDVDTPQKARQVLAETDADGLMIGRAALGRPWIFRDIAHYLATGETLTQPAPEQVGAWLLEHLDALYELYGEMQGARIARKHIQWYCADHPDSTAFWQSVNRLDRAALQRAAVLEYFCRLALPIAA
ncbi:MAG: tRNA dihydrouridine synthase [Nevskia sp.]|nr:tRNA dihydrouridine synthase [Nevskia sp.]